MRSPDKLFIDTSGWGSLFIPHEVRHKQSRDIYDLAALDSQKSNRVGIVTTSYVLAEFVPLINSRVPEVRNQLHDFVGILRNTSFIRVIYITKEIDDAAWLLLKRRPDKEWSLVDAVSFVVMEKMQIQQALTTDHHFEQAGFTRLLK